MALTNIFKEPVIVRNFMIIIVAIIVYLAYTDFISRFYAIIIFLLGMMTGRIVKSEGNPFVRKEKKEWLEVTSDEYKSKTK